MGATSPLSNRPGRLGTLAFVAFVVMSYATIQTPPSGPLAWLEVTALIAVGVALTAIGTLGYRHVRQSGSRRAAVIYFAIQIPLSAFVLYLLGRYDGFGPLIPLTLVAQSVAALPRRGVVLVGALTVLAYVGGFTLLIGDVWLAVSRAGTPFFAGGVIFTIFVTQIAINEQKARAEVERLAAELSEANHRLRAYATRVEELATVEERNRVAREIHDGLGHYLTTINVQLRAAETVLDRDPASAAEAIGKARALTQDALNDVRRSVSALRTSPVEGRPLPEIVSALVAESRAAGVETGFTVQGEPRPLSPQTGLTLHRAVQEGLTNVRKHAGEARALVTLDYRDTAHVHLTIQDDGAGVQNIGSGFGLIGLRERVQFLSGAFDTQTAPGQGFRLDVEIPE